MRTYGKNREQHFGSFWEKDFGAISGGPLFSWPLCFTADLDGGQDRKPLG